MSILNELENIIDSNNFKKWFGNSKVVDKNGNPLIVYHGTKSKSDFNIFNTKSGIKSKARNQLDFGSHFTVDYEYAKRYALKDNIKAVYLSIQNPLNLTDVVKWKGDDGFEEYLNIRKDLKLKIDPNMFFDKTGEKTKEISSVFINQHNLDSKPPVLVKEILIKYGFDGIIYNPYGKTDMRYSIPHPLSFIAFYPNQIKSAISNNGKFDINSDNIYEFDDNLKEIDNEYNKKYRYSSIK